MKSSSWTAATSPGRCETRSAGRSASSSATGRLVRLPRRGRGMPGWKWSIPKPRSSGSWMTILSWRRGRWRRWPPFGKRPTPRSPARPSIMANHPRLDWGGLKKSKLARALSLYSPEPGDVTAAGFQTMIGAVEDLRFVRWLSSGAVIWRKEILRGIVSTNGSADTVIWRISISAMASAKSHRLAVVGGADYFHYPAGTGRGSNFVFGCREVLHRIHFVRKNPELSLPRCCLVLGLRMLLSVGMAWREREWGYLARAAGNAIGFMRVLTDGDLLFRKD